MSALWGLPVGSSDPQPPDGVKARLVVALVILAALVLGLSR